MSDVMTVAISKAKRNITLSKEERDELPEASFRLIVQLGLNAYFKSGPMAKITGIRDMDETEAAAAQENAWETAQLMKAALMEGKVKAARGSSTGTKVNREQQTFRMNWFRTQIKAAHKEAGKKLPTAKQITQAAKDMMAESPELIEVADQEYAALKATAKPVTIQVTGALAKLLDSSDDLKPRVPPKRPERATTEQVVAGKAKAGKGKAKHVN